MFHLSQPEDSQAKSYTLRTQKGKRTFGVDGSNFPDTAKMDAPLSMMAIGRPPPLAREVGFKPTNEVLKYAIQDVIGDPTYRLFADTNVRAPGEKIPMRHTQWRIWHQLLIRFRLS